MRTSLSLLSLVLLAPLLGCPPAKEGVPAEDDTSVVDETDADTDADSDTDTDTDSDTDTDTDTDTDSDTDTDTDTDTDPAFTAFAGSVTVYSATDGVVACDVEADLAGTAYTGTCDNCDFAFVMDDTITRDDSPSACTNYLAGVSYINEGLGFDLFMAHADPYMVAGYYGSYPYDDAFLVGADYYGTGSAYWFVTMYDGSYYGTFSRSGNDISWSYTAESVSYYGGYSAYYDSCSSSYYGYSGSSFSGTGGTSLLDCDGLIVDVWEVTTDGTAPLDVSVDTVDATTAFDAKIWVNDPDGCSVGFADDSFDCTYPPPTWQCPSTQITTPTAGTYQIVVESLGDCAGSTAEYQLLVDGGTDVVLVHDDVSSTGASVEVTTRVDVQGSGTLLP
ncbi:MAG: hypothetical protein Q8P41_03330 [Pseudomonadota bacterium]|nr:hypothetical protein [Pseudomonadota bacterium]